MSEERRPVTVVTGASSGIGAALSTAVFGFVVVSFGQMAVFLSIASVAMIGALILWLLMPETRPTTEREQ